MQEEEEEWGWGGENRGDGVEDAISKLRIRNYRFSLIIRHWALAKVNYNRNASLYYIIQIKANEHHLLTNKNLESTSFDCHFCILETNGISLCSCVGRCFQNYNLIRCDCSERWWLRFVCNPSEISILFSRGFFSLFLLQANSMKFSMAFFFRSFYSEKFICDTILLHTKWHWDW